MSLPPLPEDLAVRLEAHQPNTIMQIVIKDVRGEVVVQRRFKDGGEDPFPWCQQHWKAPYRWEVSITPYTPHKDVWADGSKDGGRK